MPNTLASSTPLSSVDELYPIREVSRLTGVNSVTLRAWERRYGLICPIRTESGHRLYSLADVEAIRRVQLWIARGVPVSKVGDLLARQLSPIASSTAPESKKSAVLMWQEALVQAIEAFNMPQLETLSGQLFTLYNAMDAFQSVLLPLWQKLHVRRDSFGGSSEWLFFDAFLRARLWQRLLLGKLDIANQVDSAKILLAALPNGAQELELLVCALYLAEHGIKVIPLAIGQPLDEIALISEPLQPRALVLFSNNRPEPDLPQQLGRLSLGLGCAVAVAGEVSLLASEMLEGSSIACLSLIHI